MALPKKGYKPGIYRFVSGTVDGNGDFSITNIPKDGYVSGIYQLTEVTIDADGNTSVEEDDIGITAAIEVTVDGSGDLSVTEVPEEGYVSGVYRVTTSTNIPKEGFNQIDFSAVIGTISGGKWESGPGIQFNAPLTNSLIPSSAVAATYTFARADTDATVTDFEGLGKDVTADEFRPVGARRVFNIVDTDSEDLVAASFGNSNGGTVDSTTTFSTTANENARVFDPFPAPFTGDLINRSFVFSAIMWVDSGTDNARLRITHSGDAALISSDFVVTTTPTRFAFQATFTGNGSGGNYAFQNGSDALARTFNVTEYQFEEVTGQAYQSSNPNAPSEYVSVGQGVDHGANQDGVKDFATENGNTVTSGVVTEATGTAISAATLEGVTVEGARTNAERNSENFGAWTAGGGVVIAANAATSPRGDLTADSISDNSAGAIALVTSASGLLIANNNYISASVYILKDAVPASTRFSLLRVALTGGTNANLDLTLDTSTGAIDTRISAGTSTIINGYTESVGNYWRVVLNMQNDASGNTSALIRLYPAIGAGVLSGAYSASATGTITAWGAQLEIGNTASTYIPTAGLNTTRGAESLSYPNTNILDDEGTLAFTFTPSGSTAQYTGAGDRALIGVRGVNNDLVHIDTTTGKLILSDGTNETVPTTLPALVAGTATKIAIRWSATAGTMQIRQDAVEVSATFDGSMNKSTELRIGYSGAARANGTYKNLIVYNGAVSDATFTGLTA